MEGYPWTSSINLLGKRLNTFVVICGLLNKTPFLSVGARRTLDRQSGTHSPPLFKFKRIETEKSGVSQSELQERRCIAIFVNVQRGSDRGYQQR
jgi:hypothetical protein